MARASDSARWSGVVVDPKAAASELSLQLGASSRVTTRRASLAVSTTSKAGHGRPWAAAKWRRNPMSKGALCATRTQPRANSRKAGRTESIAGDAATMEFVMPVSTAMKGGISVCGLTRVWNSPRTTPPRTLTAPTSVIRDPACAEPPVVSRSTTQKVRSRRGRPSSSKLIWADHVLMDPTLGTTTDSEGCPTRPGGPRIPWQADRFCRCRVVESVMTASPCS